MFLHHIRRRLPTAMQQSQKSYMPGNVSPRVQIFLGSFCGAGAKYLPKHTTTFRDHSALTLGASSHYFA